MKRKIYKMGEPIPLTEANRLSFQEMLAEQRPPRIGGSDSVNFEGQWNNPFPEMPEFMRQHYLKQAREQGVSTAGKVYKTGLVRPEYKGRLDPEALVSSTADVKSVLERRGWGTDEQADSMVKVKAREIDPGPDRPYAVAEDLVVEHLHNDLLIEGVKALSKKEFLDRKEKKRSQLEGKK